MLLSSHEHLLRRSLKLSQCRQSLEFASTSILLPASTSRFRHHSSSSSPTSQPGRDVAILGGGITGLASAFYLSRADPTARITLFEASERLGGWIQTKHVSTDNARLVFESGPRTLRWAGNGIVTAGLFKDLGLLHDMTFVHREAPSSKNRYIYYPDRLVRLPSPREGIVSRFSALLGSRQLVSWPGLVASVFENVGKRVPKDYPAAADESVGDFISQRLNHEIADRLASAFFHGIYAGDIYKLSVRSVLPLLPWMESKFNGIVEGAIHLNANRLRCIDKRIFEITGEPEFRDIGPELKEAQRESSMFTLKGGLAGLTAALESILRHNNRVNIKMSAPVTKLEVEQKEGKQGGKINPSSPKTRVFSGAEGSSTAYDTVISTLPHQTFAALHSNAMPPAIDARTVPTVSVMVVNLFFKDPHLLASHPGFGYLIPRAVPYKQNPECALGVIFDSFAAPSVDVILGTEEPATGTKITVMMGGHWWSEWTELPSEEEAVFMARSTLARHLGITAEPDAVQAKLQRDCIPQYTVGYGQRMETLHHWLLKNYGGNLRVAGSSYSGVGLNDCVRSAWDLGKEVKERGWNGKTTGLNRFTINKGCAEFVTAEYVPGKGYALKGADD